MMSTPSHKPAQPLTAAQFDAWVCQASMHRRQILSNMMAPPRQLQPQAFLDMSTLCLDALEEVRVISAQLREASKSARIQSMEIIAESAQLLAQYTVLTESQLLQIFKGDQG
jgi:hypothetical protein